MSATDLTSAGGLAADAAAASVPDDRAAATVRHGWQVSVWLTGQTPSRDQRRGRYTRESMTHPGKMLPTIARYLIATYTQPGDLVADPMAGIGTTVVEAMHLGRHGIGVEYEPRWAQLAAANIRLAEQQGALGTGEIFCGDSRHLPALLPPAVRGVALVVTSPPYGPSTHGHVRTPGPRRGKVRKLNHRYGGTDNLAYAEQDELAAGFTQILTGCAAILRPGGIVAVTARPYRRHGELIDIPGMVAAAGTNADLHLVEECAALIAGVRDGKLVVRASFFQLKNVREAIADGDPQWLVQHEDVIIFRAGSHAFLRSAATEPGGGVTGAPDPEPASTPDGGGQATRQHAPQSPPRPAIAQADHRLDAFAPPRVDRRPQPVHPAIVHPRGGATGRRSHPGLDAGRTPDSCPPYRRPVPGSTPSDATGHRRPADRDARRPQAGSANTAGRR